MDEAQFLGYLVMAVITLGGFIGVIVQITKPVNDLRVVIQELRDCISALRDDIANHTKRLDAHSKRLDSLDIRINRLETKMEMYHKE